MVEKMLGPEKVCRRCSSPLRFRNKDSTAQIKARQFCSQSCSNKASAMPFETRFWRCVDKNGPGHCWSWTGTKDQHGYGNILRAGRGSALIKAHRASLELHGNPPPTDKVVMHSCDNPNCVNPEHLRIGTQKENIRDCAQKGRSGPRHVSGERNPSAKLNWDKVRAIRLKARQGLSQTKLGALYGVDRSTISLIVLGKHWIERAAK